MTSLKRGLVAERESSDSSTSSPPASSSQRPRITSPQNASQEASYSDRSWKHFWNEVIGVPFDDDEQVESDFDGGLSLQAETFVESWATERVHCDGDANHTSFDTSFDAQVVKGDGHTGGDSNLCYGMVSFPEQVKYSVAEIEQ